MFIGDFLEFSLNNSSPYSIILKRNNIILHQEVTKKLGYPITHIPTLSMVVVDGAIVTITSVVKQFSWLLHNTEFSSDMLLIHLGCCDVVLDVE